MVEVIEEEYVVKDDGIYHVITITDGTDESYIEDKYLPRETFIEAFNKWIKDE